MPEFPADRSEDRIMGLFDSILGGTPSGSGLSAATKALLVVLAAKAAKDYMAGRQAAPQGAAPANAPGAGGGLGGILGGLLGGANPGGGLTGGLGSILSGGGGLGGLGGLLGSLGGAGSLGALVNQFNQNGHGQAMNSWIAAGPNHTLPPEQLGEALGEGPLQELQASTGLPRQTLLEQLAHELPQAVDHVTPKGRLPTEEELAASLGGQPQA
jgi:uncharacterized protein YidB (DUF937 family)